MYKRQRLRAAALLAALALLLPAAGAGGARAASPEAPSAAQSALRAGSYGRYLAGIAEQPAGEAFTLKASAFTENPGGSASRLTEYKGGRDVLMVADQEDVYKRQPYGYAAIWLGRVFCTISPACGGGNQLAAICSRRTRSASRNSGLRTASSAAVTIS